jgi:hypothetical protein
LFVTLVFTTLTFAAVSHAQITPGTVNERFAATAVQSLHSAEYTYISTAGGVYGNLQQLAGLGLIDPVLATGEKYGYRFTVTVIPYHSSKTGASFYISAVPQRYGKTGKHSFYIDEIGVLRGEDHNGAPATTQDPVVSLCFGNESIATGSLRTVSSAEFTYFSTFGANVNFGGLRNLFDATLIDQSLASGAKCGYLFTVIQIAAVPAAGVPATFKGLAVPMHYPATGFRSFYIDDTGVLRGADHAGGFATANDPPVGN